MQTSAEAERYLHTCASPFWQGIFAAELAYLLPQIRPEDAILSVGCGPAIIERQLVERGLRVTGLDVSREALACAPDSVRAVAAAAEEMPFADDSFDLVLYIASLQFVEDYRAALAQTARILRPGGRVIALLLNPVSRFFRERYDNPDSYVRKLRHTDLAAMEREMTRYFEVSGEYFLGVEGESIVDQWTPDTAALYVLRGRLTPP